MNSLKQVYTPCRSAALGRIRSARAKVEGAIKDVLDQGLPRAYTPDLYQAKCNAVFEHVYESYQGEGKSVFTEAA